MPLEQEEIWRFCAPERQWLAALGAVIAPAPAGLLGSSVFGSFVACFTHFLTTDPTEEELLEQLSTNDPMIANGAVSALRRLWRNSQGPFASDDLDAAMGHLRARVTSPEQALRAITKSVDALKLVVAEYPDWPEPLNELATCELLRANPDESVRMSLRVLGKQPAHFDCLARLSLSHAIIGNSAEASDSIDKLETVCPILAKPLRQLVNALSAAVRQARSGGQNGDQTEQIRLEIDAETLESLGPILEGMGGFGDAMQGFGGDMEGGDFEDVMKEQVRRPGSCL